MNILFIAPLPPPIHGQSYVSNVLLMDLQKKHNVKIVNVTKKRNAGRFYFLKRYIEVFNILYLVWKQRKGNDAVYITTSQSLLGNIKDILTYLCFYSSTSIITIHLHGGAIRKELWDKYPFLLSLNKFFIKKMNGVIISGDSHRYIFSDLIENSKIHLVPNFAMDDIFISNEELQLKFEKRTLLKLLYVSGMRSKKGYLELLDAFVGLPENYKKQIQIEFAGEFETDKERETFIETIDRYENVRYHGVISDLDKIKLFQQSHIFCLPTKYLEGQPISILEAYASGNTVLTTNLGGISDIFKDELNGLQIFTKDEGSFVEKIKFCIDNTDYVQKTAEANLELAKKYYKKNVFVKSVATVVERSS